MQKPIHYSYSSILIHKNTLRSLRKTFIQKNQSHPPWTTKKSKHIFTNSVLVYKITMAYYGCFCHVTLNPTQPRAGEPNLTFVLGARFPAESLVIQGRRGNFSPGFSGHLTYLHGNLRYPPKATPPKKKMP